MLFLHVFLNLNVSHGCHQGLYSNVTWSTCFFKSPTNQLLALINTDKTWGESIGWFHSQRCSKTKKSFPWGFHAWFIWNVLVYVPFTCPLSFAHTVLLTLLIGWKTCSEGRKLLRYSVVWLGEISISYSDWNGFMITLCGALYSALPIYRGLFSLDISRETLTGELWVSLVRS